MFTPQQIEQISFSRATFGGYDMQAVDEFLEPLTEDYITLYKENALLKSKMRVLVGKLEEYRANEASMKAAIIDAQKTCDAMVKDAEAKCTQMLNEANVQAAENARNADVLIAAEEERVEKARRAAADEISKLEDELRGFLETLALIREGNMPVEPVSQADEGAMAEEISQNLEALVGTTEDIPARVEPKISTDTNKFTNLQFGRNYDPNRK